jgi:hypothetical protein
MTIGSELRQRSLSCLFCLSKTRFLENAVGQKAQCSGLISAVAVKVKTLYEWQHEGRKFGKWGIIYEDTLRQESSPLAMGETGSILE